MSDPYGLEAADRWVATHFRQIPPGIRSMIVHGVASTLYPYAAVAGASDMADALADRWPDMAAALDELAAGRLAELTHGGT